MTTRWARFARGWVAAAFATYVAAFSHVAAGGGHPPIVVIALALAFSGVACVWLAGRRFSRVRLAASVGLSQVLYHGLFAVFGVSTSDALPGMATGMGHHHTITLPTAGSPTTPVAYDLGMLAAHAVAAIATVLFMLYGEHAARTIAGRARLAISPLLRAARLYGFAPQVQWTRTPAARPDDRTLPPRDLAPLIGSLRHRGPPAGLSRA